MLILEYLQANPVSFIACAAVLGLVIGSFLNVVIYRLPVLMEREWHEQCAEYLGESDQSDERDPERFNLVVPRSRCPTCGHGITALENIPVVSWLFLRGRCSACGAGISIRYPAIEALSGIMSAVVAWHFGFGVPAVCALLFTWALIALSFIDIDQQLLPDSITLPCLWLGLSINLFGVFATLENSVLGAIAGYGVLWGLFHLFRLLTGKEGMGFGDFKLLAFIGAWLGWQGLPVTIFGASLIGAVVGISMIVFRRHDRNIPIPFGPYLAGAGWISMLWDHDLLRWYLS